MSTALSVEFRGSYLHVTLGPDYEITPAGTTELWSTVAKACAEHRCTTVLAEGNVIARRMNTNSAFESGSLAGRAVAGLKLAFCMYGHRPDELTEFFKTVARNRGARVQFFSDRRAALEWLGVVEDEIEPTTNGS
jgi:hypothetical protein